MTIHSVELLMLGLELILCTLLAAVSVCALAAAQSPNESSQR